MDRENARPLILKFAPYARLIGLLLKAILQSHPDWKTNFSEITQIATLKDYQALPEFCVLTPRPTK